MRKSVWMAQLERALSREGMTGTEKRTVLNYYEEMYQDRLDEGAEEEAIIKEFGFPEDVAQSVRENDSMSRDEVRKDKAGRYARENDDIPVGTRVPNYDVEGEGYSRPAPQYSEQNAQQYTPHAQYEAPNAQYSAPTPPQYVAPTPPTPPTPPSAPQPPQNNGSSVSILRTLICIIAAFALLSVGFGLIVGGIAVIAGAFATIAFSAGIWLIAFGIGLVLAAIGCLIFASAIHLFKSIFNSTEGGAK